MLKKVFKYDFKYLGKRICLIIALLIVTSISARITNSFLLTSSINFIGVVLTSICIMFCVVSPIITLVLIVIRYTKNMLKDEGYLTHTLPVKSSTLLVSKILNSFIYTIFTGLAIIIAMFILFFDVSTFRLFYDALSSYFPNIFTSTELIKLSILSFVAIIVSCLANLLIIITCLNIGHSYPKAKIGYSILFFAVYYIVNQLITSIILRIFTSYLTNNSFSYLSLIYIGITTTIVLYSIYGIVSYFISLHYLKYKLNLE